MKKNDSENILGYQITKLSLDNCINQIVQWVDSGKYGRYFVCANPHSLQVACSDETFRNAILHADLVIPDGVGIVIASKILGGQIAARVTGSDVFWGVSCALNQRMGYRYFFLGSTEKSLSLIRARLKADFPNIEVIGTFSPSFKDGFPPEENLAIIQTINHVQPHVLWVGMTAPKQEKWIYENRERLNVNLAGPIGAAFDFYAGTVARSNPWFLDHGLEWLPRLIRDPHRLWYRNFVSTPVYLLRVFGQRLLSRSDKQRT